MCSYKEKIRVFIEPRQKARVFAKAKAKAQVSCAEAALLISAFDFTVKIV